MLFYNATIITMDRQRRIIQHGAVAVADQRIEAVGKSEELLDKYPHKKRINCNGNILLPGLIDTHIHLPQVFLRGMSESRVPFSTLEEWLGSLVYPYQGSFTAEDGQATAALCVLEMLKTGTTAFIDCLLAENYGLDGIAELCVRSGVRAALGHAVMDISPEDQLRLRMHEGLYETREKCMRETIEYFDKWNGSADGRIQVWFGCRSVTEHNNLSLYDEVGQLSRERGIGITIHLSEEESGIAYANRLGYPTLTHAVHEHGLLGPHTVLVHFTASLQEDWEICAKTGTHVSHCPGVVAGSQWVQLPIVRLIDLGINVSLGCDNSANGLDLLRDLRIACYVSRNAHNDRESILAEKVLELATINGAKAMGIHDQVGSIEAGKRADFIVIDTDSPNLVPYWDPITAIVYNAHGSDVHTVVIDGRIIVQCKKILTLDEDAILDDIKRRYLQIARRAGISPDPYRSIWPIE